MNPLARVSQGLCAPNQWLQRLCLVLCFSLSLANAQSWSNNSIYTNEIYLRPSGYSRSTLWMNDLSYAQLASGVYFYRLSVRSSSSQAGGFVSTKKMMLIK